MSAYSQALPGSDANQYTLVSLLIQQALADMQTVSVAEVIAVHGGGVAPTGTVDVQILVNLMTGNRQAVPHGVIYGLPFVRIQGGPNAVICDPVAGDIGLVTFASRDISGVKAAKGVANPSSYRVFDWADGIYVGGLLNATPTTYVQLAGGNVTIVATSAITLTSPSNKVNGPLEVTGATKLDSTLDVYGGHNATCDLEWHDGGIFRQRDRVQFHRLGRRGRHGDQCRRCQPGVDDQRERHESCDRVRYDRYRFADDRRDGRRIHEYKPDGRRRRANHSRVERIRRRQRHRDQRDCRQHDADN